MAANLKTNMKYSGSALKKNRRNRRSKIDPPKVVKQRGLYVEKKFTNPAQGEKKLKSPSRPDKTSFLYTALTMLSRPSASTQCPDHPAKEVSSKDHHTPKNIAIASPKNSAKTKPIVNKDAAVNTKQEKKKYKSRILNGFAEQAKEDHVTVIQATREISDTPSVYSFADVSKENVDSSVQEVDKKLEEHADSPAENTPDKTLFKFYDNSLVYNVKVKEAKVVKPSNPVEFQEKDDKIAEIIKNNANENDYWKYWNSEASHTEGFYIKDDQIKPVQKPKKKVKTVKTNMESRKKDGAKNANNSLLNIIKKELQQTQDYYEPRSIFEALKQMVDNKRKHLRFKIKTSETSQRRKINKEKINDFPQNHESKKTRPIKNYFKNQKTLLVTNGNVKFKPFVKDTHHSFDPNFEI